MGGPTLNCEKHGEGIKLYYKTHGVALCYLCAMIDHQEQSCVCQYIEDAIMESEAKLNDLKEKAMEKLELCRVYGDQIHKCRLDFDTHLLQALNNDVDSVINEAIKTNNDREKEDTAKINQEIDDKNRKLQEEIQKINDKIRHNNTARKNRLELSRKNAEKRQESIDSKAKPNDLNEKARDKLKSRRDYGNQIHKCGKDTDPHLQALNDDVETLINEAIKTDKDREKEDTARINQEIDDKNRKLQEEIQQINNEIQNDDKAKEKRLELNRTQAEKRRAPVDNKQHGLKTDITQISVEEDRRIGDLEKSWEDSTITSSGPNTECAFGQSSRGPSTGGEVKAAFSNKSIDHKRTSSYDVATNDTTKPSPLIMTKLSFNFCIRAFTLLLVSSVVAGEDINIDCRGDVSLTSPYYPLNYPDDANTKWFITAPEGRRILVTFTDFNVEVNDVLHLADKVDTHNSMRYTGEQMQFPPFLTKGNELEMTFISFPSGTRKGFNVSSSCYTNSSDANVARIVGVNSPGKGFLELLNGTRSDDWRRVCKDNFDEMVTEVVCGELGYPAVKKVSYGTDDCKSDGQDCSKAPICTDYTYRLEDCTLSSGNCTSADAVKVECYEPGFKGCYDPEDLPQRNGFIFESTSQCVSSCRAITRKALAIMIGTQCFCSTADEVNLPNITPATCNQPTQDTRRVNNSFVYDVSVGFCDELNDVIHGSWDSKITWFGSIAHLTCDDGYSLNGSGALQCVPELSPDHPIWKGSLSSCEQLKDGTSRELSANGTQNHEEYPDEQPYVYYSLFLIPGITIIVIIVYIIFGRNRIGDKLLAWKRNVRNRARESMLIGGRLPREPSGTRQQPFHDVTSGIHLTVTLNAEGALINTTHFNNGESQPRMFHTPAQHAQDYIDNSQPSNTTITPFPSLQLPIPHRENPYQMEESESNAYYSAMGSGLSSENNTMQIITHIGRDENTYELANSQENIQDQKPASDYRAETRSMSNRPLPHRPISYGVYEGPSLPPRRNLETCPSNTGQNTFTRFDDTCLRICALDYTTLPNDDPLGLSVTSKTHTLHHNISSHDKDQTPGKGNRAQKGGDDYPCTGATSRASEHHGYYSVDDLKDERGFNRKSIQPLSSKPDPFYHCLENDQQMGRDREDLLKSEIDNGDFSHTDMMVENVLYYPLNIQTGDVR